jgi:very-short-patch-repair endonuclease
MTPEQKTEAKRKNSLGGQRRFAQMSEENKALFAEKSSVQQTQSWARLTPEGRKQRASKFKAYRADLPEEERRAWLAKSIASPKADEKRRSPEVIGRRVAGYKAAVEARTEEQQERVSENTRRAQIARKEREAAEGKAAFVSQVEREVLAALDIPLETQKGINGSLVDGLSYELRLVVEVHGDYWHCNPLQWEASRLNKTTGRTAAEQWERDAKKAAWHLQNGYSVLVVWQAALKRDGWLKVAREFIQACPSPTPRMITLNGA